jgi:uncharacterized delta-60 repeat protein
MALITRQAKGSKLTIEEMDDNLLYLEELAQDGVKNGINYIIVNADDTPENNGDLFIETYNTAKDIKISDISSLSYVTFMEANYYQIGEYVLLNPFIMKSVSQNRYFLVEFTSWGQGQVGGGFSYYRTEITTQGLTGRTFFEKTANGNETDVVITGVLEITRDIASKIYNVIEEDGFYWDNPVSPTDTTWAIYQPKRTKILLSPGDYYFNQEFLMDSKYIDVSSIDGNRSVNFVSDYFEYFNSTVNSIIEQPDGKILFGGRFTSYNTAQLSKIVRVNTNFLEDNTFVSGYGFNNTINKVARQSDGKFLVGGQFEYYNTNETPFFTRLTSGGTIDNTFITGTGFNSTVNDISLQTDGKIIVVGGFTAYSGQTRNRLVRLNSNGGIDNTFSVGSGLNNDTFVIELQSDNKILIGGNFTSYSGQTRNRFIRLNSDGTIDNTFTIGTGFSSTVRAVKVQPDDKILVGGNFTSYSGESRNRLIRLNSDGTIDNTFSIGTGFDSLVRDIELQDDGKILVGGSFTTYSGQTYNGIIRLNIDGTIDNTFNIGDGFDLNVFSSSRVTTIEISSDDKILVGGAFSTYNNKQSNGFVILNSDGTPFVETGYETHVKIESSNTLIKGIDFTKTSFTIEDDLTDLVMENCIGGDFSFGEESILSGTFKNCEGGKYSFGYNGELSGTVENCIGGLDSFGNGDNGILSGRLYSCRLTEGTFNTVSSGRTYFCVDGNGDVNNQ